MNTTSSHAPDPVVHDTPLSIKRLLLYTVAVTLGVWFIFSWPLPRYAAEGIPAAHERVEEQAVRYMIPGDHLQLLYYFWVFGDMIRGETPWFYNLYEFNTGDD